MSQLRIAFGGELPAFALAPGIEARPLVGDRLNINIVTLDPGAVAAVHAHDEEQMGYVVSGECEFADGTSTWTLGPGDAYHAPPRVPHGARALDGGCVILDVFAPPKAEILTMLGG